MFKRHFPYPKVLLKTKASIISSAYAGKGLDLGTLAESF